MHPSVLLFLVIAALPAVEDMEVQASLSGYNFLWPSQRCCAFELHIDPKGREIVLVKVNTGEEQTKHTHDLNLTSEQLNKLRSMIKEMDFFNIPAEFGFRTVDCDQRRVRVRIGQKAHSISIPDSIGPNASAALRQQFAGLNNLWALIAEKVAKQR